MIARLLRKFSQSGRTSPQDDASMTLPVRLNARHLQASGPPDAEGETVDQAMIWVTAILLLWGLVMVYSASIALPEMDRYARYTHHHFLQLDALWLLISSIVALLAWQVPISVWEKLARPLFALSLVLLVLVLIPHIGKVVNGSRRWIGLGLLSFQPSELAKFTVVLYAADYMVRKMEDKEHLFKAVWPMCAAVLAAGVLLLAETDMGAFLVIAVIAMGILFLGGVNATVFLLITAAMVAAFGLMVTFSDMHRKRIFAYLDPWNADYALDKGYQLTHSLIAIGRGEVFGVCLGGSGEKLNWLPEAHTDFLLAVIGEEFGLVGIMLVIGLFLWLVRRMMNIGRQAITLKRVFAGLLAQGVAIWVGFQAFINMGVNLGALPTKGLTLPLMSYGGSAMLLNLAAIAVVLRVDHENRALMPGGRT